MTDELPNLPIVMVTGHRRLTKNQIAWLHHPETMLRVITKLQGDHGMQWAVSGMALNTDQIWAEMTKVCGARLHAMIPFTQQASHGKWTEQQIAHWENLLETADMVTDVGRGRNPTSWKQAAAMLHARNDAMLNASSAVVAVWDRTNHKGGTWSAVNKAVERDLPIVWMDPRTERITKPTPARWATILSSNSD